MVIGQHYVPRFQVSMQVTYFMDSGDAREQLFEESAWRLPRKGAMSHYVVKKLPSVQSFEHLAVWGLARASLVGDRDFGSFVVQTNDVRVLAQICEHLEVILVYRDCIWVGTLVHSL